MLSEALIHRKRNSYASGSQSLTFKIIDQVSQLLLSELFFGTIS
jgi:hypothetical protein